MEATKPLPARQKEVLSLIVKFSEEHGYPPTLADLATILGLKNRMTVHQHVAALRKKGLVHWEPGLNRSLRALPDGVALLGLDNDGDTDDSNNDDGQTLTASAPFVGGMPKGKKSSSHTNISSLDARRAPGIPMAGAIAAGTPTDALETNEYLEVESRYGDDGCFALKVKGESMIEDGIYDGDFVIIKPNPSPNNGDVVVALLEDGSATLKRFFKEKGGYRLQPANASMQPIFVDAANPLTIQGTVVGLFRKMS